MTEIKVNNIKEYNEAINKCRGSRYVNKDAITLSWILRTRQELEDPEIREIFGSNYTICDEAIKLLDEIVMYSSHRMGVLKGVEITEEDFYWVIKDVDRDIEVSSSCVGRIDKLDIELLRKAISYEKVEKINNTTLDIAFIMGGIWREQNPTKEMIEKILELAWTYREDNDQTELEYIMKNYKK